MTAPARRPRRIRTTHEYRPTVAYWALRGYVIALTALFLFVLIYQLLRGA